MKTVFLTLCAALAVIARAEQRVASYDWAELARAGTNLPGKTLISDGRSALLVQNTNDLPLQVRLLTIPKAAITSTSYALRGEISYMNVEGDGFLEMWNVFPPARADGAEMKFFSRTMGESGDMGRISGHSDWRRFVLPFHASGAATPPSALELNLVLPGRGEVYLGPLELVEFSPGAPPFGAAYAWWSGPTGGLIGGSLGALFGCLAGLTAWLASKGRARAFVIGASWFCIAAGVALSILGLVAVLMRQPYGVWFPLLLGGVLIVLILPGRLRLFQRQYEEQELRRMGAADAM